MHGLGWRNPWRLIGALTAAIGALALMPAHAHGGVYVVAQCSPGITGNAADAVFTRDSNHYVGRLACGDPSFHGVQVVHQAANSARGRFGRWTWRAPSGTFMTAASLKYNVARQDDHVPYIAVKRSIGDDVAVGLRFGDQWQQGGVTAVQGGAEFTAKLFCASPVGKTCGSGPSAHLRMKQLRLTLRDSAPPAVAPAGTLFEEGERHGQQTVTPLVADSGGGVSSASVIVNGELAAFSALPCSIARGLATRLVPCPLGAVPVMSVDTARRPFRDGMNDVAVCVSDYANQGPGNVTCALRRVVTDNSCPSSSVGGGAELTAEFGGRAKTHATVGSRERIRVEGTLRGAGGSAIKNALICVQTRLALSSSKFRLIRTALTGQNGRFSVRLPAGASRVVQVEYRFDSFQIERELRLRVRAHPSFHVRPHRARNGGRVYFRGRVPAPRGDGRVVVLQAQGPGSDEWIRFRTPRTNSDGVFRARYRFGNSSRIKYRFRALVQRQRGYPYLRGVSKTRRVFVR